MIIECPNCSKKFNLDEKLIYENGRTLKCSACNHIWHYKINPETSTSDQKISANKNIELNINISKNDKNSNEIKEKINDKDISDKSGEVYSKTKNKDKEVEIVDETISDEKPIKLKMIFIYFIIIIISLLGIIFLLDTFKNNLSNIFPGIIPLYDSFYETLLDLKLFFKDLAA